ncbi:Vacuolar DHA amino acid exporter [Mycena indigotica]|uniref:Vacuolar DHA amino acid exporter n=1 Tax=Mycena indigotica TaxID=2126181 RepID=A0A8H6S2I0_9AGAR|nr:Vacuolar DHA amino acid exporter [Mycena indigotica]KAF7292025.1 Vacuolar DHA amino acid exporter [Mycena indigotica]
MMNATTPPRRDLKRQSRVSPARRGTATMEAIVEVLEVDDEEVEVPPKRSSVKARRRQGVSDLRVPVIALFAAENGGEDGWRVSLDGEEVYDFPLPPRSAASSSSSGSGSEAGSSPATSPGPSPVRESHGHGLQRWKTVKPLTITKRSRSASPVPPAPLPQLQLPEDDHDADDDDNDDDGFYASYARGVFALAPPLPALPLPPARADSATRRRHRESAVVAPPRPVSALLTPPASPHTHARSASADVVPNFSRPTSLALRAGSPPRAKSRALSVWRDSDFAAYAPLISAAASPTSSGRSDPRSPSPPLPRPTPPPASSRSRPPPLSAVSAVSALLSPASSKRRISAEVPSDIDLDGDWDDVFDAHADYPEIDVPRSPSSFSYDEEARERRSGWPRAESRVPPAPAPVWLDAPVSPVSESAWSFPEDSQAGSGSDDDEPPLRSHSPDDDDDDVFGPPPGPGPGPRTPVLRSRWSASTLASVRSGSATSPRSPAFLRSPASGKTFAFARRYLRAPASPAAPKRRASVKPKPAKAKKAPKPAPRPMGSVSAPIHRPASAAAAGSVVVGRPPAPMSVLAAAASAGGGAADASPFAAAWPFSAQWVGVGAGSGTGRFT